MKGERESRRGEKDPHTAAAAKSRNRQRLSFASPPPNLSRTVSMQDALRSNALLSPFVGGGGTPPAQPTTLNMTTESSVYTTFDDEPRPEEVYRWFQELAYRQADGQALHTVIYLSAAALLWALLYFNYLLLSVYFTPITWAILCSIPLRRWQDSILRSIERDTSVRTISLKILTSICAILPESVGDSVTGKLSCARPSLLARHPHPLVLACSKAPLSLLHQSHEPLYPLNYQSLVPHARQLWGVGFC
jgi:hypothetical protein